MKKIKLEEKMYLYSVPAFNENGLAQNICALIDGKEALLIDAGYKNECRQVVDDLTAEGIKIVKVIPSHFHPDHLEGIFLMNNPLVYGNAQAVNTLEQFYIPDSIGPLIPTEVIDDNYKLQFGKFTLTFCHAPGHSDCSMLIFINNKYIHLGDLYIKDSDGSEVLPYVKWNNVIAHIASLNKVLKYSNLTALISHGPCPVETIDLITGIVDRVKYLQALLDSDNKILTTESVKNCSRPFKRMQWREDV